MYFGNKITDLRQWFGITNIDFKQKTE